MVRGWGCAWVVPSARGMKVRSNIEAELKPKFKGCANAGSFAL
jgi:hypothetical protein